MNRVLAGFAIVSAGIISLSILAPATQAGPVVRFNLNYSTAGTSGNINYFDVELYDTAAPITVANFLKYVNSGAYNNTIIHRDAEIDGNPFVMQGGGFTPKVSGGSVTSLDPIVNYGTIQNEFSSTRSNVRGTIAMAKVGGDPNSATNQWFVNLGNNSANLDNQNGGFTVFGQIIGQGMTLIDSISSLPKSDLSSTYGDTFNEVPLFNSSASFVTVTSASVLSMPTVNATGKMTGFVYVDTNHNGVMDGADYAIADAKVALLGSGGNAAVATVRSSKDGSFHFNNLAAGTYSVQMQTPCSAPGQDSSNLQMIVDKDGNIVSVGSVGTVGQNVYSGITLADGQGGINFNFAEAVYPVSLISARMLLNTSAGMPHTSGIAVPGANVGGDSSLAFGNVLIGTPSSATLTVSNLGGEGSELSGTLPGASGQFGPTDSSDFGPLGSGQDASRQYTFTPTVRGTSTQDISVATDGGNLKVTLSGVGVAPVASVTNKTGYALVGSSGTTSVIVKNIGDGNLSGAGEISNLQGSIVLGEGSLSGGDGSVNLADGASQEYSYSFTATKRGAVAAGTLSASFTNGNPNGTNSAYSTDFDVTGTGVAPVSSLAQSDTKYALVGTVATAQVKVTNIGDGNLSGAGDSSNLIGSISGGSGNFSGAGGSFSLADAASQTFDYTYMITGRGTTDGTVILANFDNGNPDGTNTVTKQNFNISCTGVAPVSTFTQSNAYTLVGTTGAATVTIGNTGDGNKSGLGEISNLRGDISAGSNGLSGDGGNISVADGASQTFSYTHAPTVRGTASSAITINFYNGSPDGINAARTEHLTLNAQGVAPVQSVIMSAADAGLVRIGTTGTAKITVSNIGDGNLSNAGETSNLKGTIAAASGSFSGSGGSISLADAVTQTFSYTYAPTSHTTESGAVAVQFTNGSANGANLAETVNAQLSGRGVGPTYSSNVTPDHALDFETVPQATVKSMFLDISNSTTDLNGGNAALTDMTLLNAVITGTDGGLFSIENFTAGTTLHEGDSLNLEIKYNGTGSHGDKSALLTIYTDEGAALGGSGSFFTYDIKASLAPEPGSMVLLGMAGLAFGGLAWRRRKAKASVS